MANYDQHNNTVEKEEILSSTFTVKNTPFSTIALPDGVALREHLGLVTASAVDGRVLHHAKPGSYLFETRCTITPGGQFLLGFAEGKHYAQKRVGKVNELMFMRSADKGMSWTSPKSAFDINYSQHGFVPFVPRRSKRIYAFGTQPIPGEWFPDRPGMHENAPIGFRWSDDDGYSWSDAQLIRPQNDPGFTGMSVMRMTETDTGQWLIGSHEADWSVKPLQTRQYILRSDDQGQSWRVSPGRRPRGWQNVEYRRMDEGRPIAITTFIVLLMARTPEGHLWVAHSFNGGISWEKFSPTPLVHPDAPPMLFMLSNRTLVAFHHNRHTKGKYEGLSANIAGYKDRSELWVSTSVDVGLTWTQPRFVLSNALVPNLETAWLNYQCSYADLVVDGGDLHLFIPHRWKRVLHLRFKEEDIAKLPTLDELKRN
jgi:hypothetical protein